MARVWLPFGSEDERNAATDTDKINDKNNFLVFTILHFRFTITVSLHSSECLVTPTALIISNRGANNRTPLLQVNKISPRGCHEKELSRLEKLSRFIFIPVTGKAPETVTFMF